MINKLKMIWNIIRGRPVMYRIELWHAGEIKIVDQQMKQYVIENRFDHTWKGSK